ncbi:hypothetical protein [uncultured Draconibacterium sp.]|uniref:hypothetical protein n=1 Tax=uncultured Draconibacterium sp. TaxID=1573823 RepID=UPI0032615961
MKRAYILLILISIISNNVWSQKDDARDENNRLFIPSDNLLNPYRLPYPDTGVTPQYIDLDSDGDPDVLKTSISGFPVQWIDDDDDMSESDFEGDMDNDCLMVDRNRDGEYASYSDVVIDWVDNNNDGSADMQIYADYCSEKQKEATWGPGHVMISIDLDNDNIMNHIDWNTFHLRAWFHNGLSDFYQDYHGNSLFLKIHTSPEKMNDVRLNWENPFLFYDPDNDGLTEYAIRVLDTPVPGNTGDEYLTNLKGSVDWISMSYDLDNDNAAGNEFDLDMTIHFSGNGFNYMNQLHSYPQMRGLPKSDKFFKDPRIRQLTELIYPDHESIKELIFQRGDWDYVYFTFDEDDDCNRWERVEMYHPKNPFISGAGKGGLDDNPQADVAGDRGEWDLDNSGGGQLYVSKFDGRIHLYGAETGYWRIDQNAYYYQGMGGMYDGYGPGRLSFKAGKPFPLIKYNDTDDNGFFDQIAYDLDGDEKYETTISLTELGIADECEIIDFSGMDYKELNKLFEDVAENMWENAETALAVAKMYDINTRWYALLMHPRSIQQKYHMGYWLQFYLYKDLLKRANLNGKRELIKHFTYCYYSGNWSVFR